MIHLQIAPSLDGVMWIILVLLEAQSLELKRVRVMEEIAVLQQVAR